MIVPCRPQALFEPSNLIAEPCLRARGVDLPRNQEGFKILAGYIHSPDIRQMLGGIVNLWKDVAVEEILLMAEDKFEIAPIKRAAIIRQE
jgi:hypothetical protein